MNAHSTDCNRPRWWLRRFAHRPWICDVCGQAWVTEIACAMGGCVRLWKRWPENDKEQSS